MPISVHFSMIHSFLSLFLVGEKARNKGAGGSECVEQVILHSVFFWSGFKIMASDNFPAPFIS